MPENTPPAKKNEATAPAAPNPQNENAQRERTPRESTLRERAFSENLERFARRDRVFLNNPVIMQGLGIAPVVIAASNLRNALILAVAVLLLLTPTRMLATFIGKRLPLYLRAITYVLTAGLFYVGVSYLVSLTFGTSVVSVGIYLPLLVFEPLILKRYESPKSERVSTSFKKGMVTTAGFCLVLFIVAGLREILATGQLGGAEVLRTTLLPMAAMPAGGFLILGLLAAVWRAGVRLARRWLNLTGEMEDGEGVL